MRATTTSQMYLDKTQQQQLRHLIDKGLTQEYIRGLQEVKEIIEQCEHGTCSVQQGWKTLYHNVRQRDKWIGKRFHNIKVHDYCDMVALLLSEGLLEQHELATVSHDVQKMILQRLEMKQTIERFSNETSASISKEMQNELTVEELRILKASGFRKIKIGMCHQSRNTQTGEATNASRTLYAMNDTGQTFTATQEWTPQRQALEELVWKETEGISSSCWEKIA